MQDNLASIWEQTLSRIEPLMPQSSFNTWLKGTRPLTLTNNVLYVRIANEFAKDWVDSRYREPMQQALQTMVGQDWGLEFILPGAPIPNNVDLVEEVTPADPVIPASSPETIELSTGQDEILPGVLNPRYTFDTFVVGNSNRFAHAASLAVAEAPARAYNPLFIYGGVGLGKTHLMQAVGHYTIEHNPRSKVVYVSSEKFTNDLINAIGKKAMVEFRDQYRNVDVLLIDDIQFVAGKESTQEEFFHTFNALYESNKQIVMSSDRPPKEIPTLEERLRSRFEWGLTTDIQPPDLETRIAILRKKAATERLEIPEEVLSYIANRVHSNIRELEGALNRVIAVASLSRRDISVEIAEEALKDIVGSHRQRQITIDSIQNVVANHYSIKVAEMRSKKRTRAVTFPRQVAMYLARDLTDASLPRIGEEFGGRDHTTVLHAYDKIQRMLQKNPSLQKEINELAQELRNP
ncbi:MAG: chromosomal replication initiator protein DnaA [Firmicutes bacterium]|jgi:chromosomal replication initiator protein|nr:chromosomal replication initiator protein DnaA [Bacillota bacterium]